VLNNSPLNFELISLFGESIFEKHKNRFKKVSGFGNPEVRFFESMSKS